LPSVSSGLWRDRTVNEHFSGAAMSEWIEWNGGEWPFSGDEQLMIRWIGGDESGPYTAKYTYGWSMGEIVAYRIVEPEAHMMSAPITVREPGVQVDTVTISMDEYVLLKTDTPYAKMQARLLAATRAERDALRAEVERLRDEAGEAAKVIADQDTQLEIAEEQLKRTLLERDEANERLRKGKDDGPMARQVAGGDRGGSVATRSDLRMVADTLDPRLGTQQPDGEPCEPMSARKWRWLP